MSTPAEQLAEEAAVEARAAVEGTATEVVEDIETDDSDLGNDFIEMDDSYSNEFETSDLPASDEEPVEEVLEEATEPEVEPEPEAEAEEASTLEAAPSTTEELQAQLLTTQAELIEARKQRLEQDETRKEETEATDVVSDESFKAAHEEARSQLMEQYALSQEDADSFVTEPEAIIPGKLADLHMAVTYSVMEGIRSALPGWIEAVNAETGRVSEEQGVLFEAFPQLKDHVDATEKALATYRQLNPGATRDEVVAKGGAMAMVALGLNAAPIAAAASKPAAKAPPHRPAATTGRAGKPAQRATNEFSSMAEDDEFDGL